MSQLGQALRTSRIAQFVEIVVVFAVAMLIVLVGWQIVGESPLARQAVAWVGSVAMMALIWSGLRLRSDSVSTIGLMQSTDGWNGVVRMLVQALVALVLAGFGFVLGAVVMGPPENCGSQADMSGYNFLQGNLPMLLGALAMAYIGSSFAEEFVYRGFLVTRFNQVFGDNRIGVTLAVVASAVMFGAAHFTWGVTGIVQTTGMGLGFAIAFLLFKRRLWPLVLAHAVMDTLLFMQLYAQPPAAG